MVGTIFLLPVFLSMLTSVLMASKELVPLIDEVEQRIEIGVQVTDLTLVLNAHHTMEQARQSAAQVPPDSLVFIEGFSMQPGVAPYGASRLNGLNELRLDFGKFDNIYQRYKALLQKAIEQDRYQEPKSPTDFMPFGFELLKTLIDKDCFVSYADFEEINTKYTIDAEEINRRFRERADSIFTSSVATGPKSGVGRMLKQLKESVQNRTVAHAERELLAVSKMLATAGALSLYFNTESLSKNEQGQFQTYLLYGSGHKYSLSSQLESRNVLPRIIELFPVNNYSYIDSITPNSYDNRPRRLAHVVLSPLVSTFNYDSLNEEVYERLDFLNTANEEEQLKFLLACLRVYRETAEGSENSYRDFLSVLRSFMPSPQRFVP